MGRRQQIARGFGPISKVSPPLSELFYISTVMRRYVVPCRGQKMGQLRWPGRPGPIAESQRNRPPPMGTLIEAPLFTDYLHTNFRLFLTQIPLYSVLITSVYHPTLLEPSNSTSTSFRDTNRLSFITIPLAPGPIIIPRPVAPTLSR